MTTKALLDSNVIIAMLAEDHAHHTASLALLTGNRRAEFAITAHSYAEAYSTLTRRSHQAPFRFTAKEAWAALESVRAVTVLIGLTPAQTFDAIRQYALTDGIGARLYDRLIGEAAVAHGIDHIVTWNTGHMHSLFPALTIATPAEFDATYTNG